MTTPSAGSSTPTSSSTKPGWQTQSSFTSTIASSRLSAAARLTARPKPTFSSSRRCSAKSWRPTISATSAGPALSTTIVRTGVVCSASEASTRSSRRPPRCVGMTTVAVLRAMPVAPAANTTGTDQCEHGPDEQDEEDRRSGAEIELRADGCRSGRRRQQHGLDVAGLGEESSTNEPGQQRLVLARPVGRVLLVRVVRPRRTEESLWSASCTCTSGMSSPAASRACVLGAGVMVLRLPARGRHALGVDARGGPVAATVRKRRGRPDERCGDKDRAEREPTGAARHARYSSALWRGGKPFSTLRRRETSPLRRSRTPQPDSA